MSEIRGGLRHVLAKPSLYDFFQRLVGAYAWRRHFITHEVNPIVREGDRVIDIGCGTGELFEYLPRNVFYYGFDRNPDYIRSARQRFPEGRAVFECESIGRDSGDRFPKCHVALAIGVMHHLDDSGATALLEAVRNVLTEDGHLFMLDPVYVPEQSRLAKFVVARDRGQNVRTREDYLALCRRYFPRVEHAIELRPVRIPYTGITVRCSSGIGEERRRFGAPGLSASGFASRATARKTTSG